MAIIHPFQALFAVPMTCDSCAKDVSDSLHKLSGVTKVVANLQDQLVSVEGTASPSAVVEAIQSTGRDAILRGAGASNSAAVSILETYCRPPLHGAGTTQTSLAEDGGSDREVRGLARLVQVSPTVTLVDLSLHGVAPGTYRATVREFGDLKHGVLSTGQVWVGAATEAVKEARNGLARGVLGFVEVGEDGRGSVFLDKEVQVWEIIGRALVVARQDESVSVSLANDDNTVAGVIARSAGMWDNDKKVCSCTGKTLWDERKESVRKGVL